MWIPVFLVSGLIFGAACSFIAKEKGKDGCTWFAVGFFLGFIGLLIIGFIPSEDKRRDSRQTARQEQFRQPPSAEIPEPQPHVKEDTQDAQPDSEKSLEPEVSSLRCYTYRLSTPSSDMPLAVIKISILVDLSKEKVLLRLKLANNSGKAVHACKCRVFCFDSFGSPFEHAPKQGGRVLFQDLDLPGKAVFIPRKNIDISSYPETRKCDVIVTDVLYADGSSWQLNQSPRPISIIEPADETAEPSVFQEAQGDMFDIGDIGPAGGLVFFDKGAYSRGWRYMEVAPSFTQWEDRSWAEVMKPVETGTKIGTGKQNTEGIVDALIPSERGKSAAGLCQSFSYGGCADWFLPSKDELALLVSNLIPLGVGNIASSGFYWSSSIVPQTQETVWVHSADGARQEESPSNSLGRVRAVRYF